MVPTAINSKYFYFYSCLQRISSDLSDASAYHVQTFQSDRSSRHDDAKQIMCRCDKTLRRRVSKKNIYIYYCDSFFPLHISTMCAIQRCTFCWGDLRQSWKMGSPDDGIILNQPWWDHVIQPRKDICLSHCYAFLYAALGVIFRGLGKS